jgi:hypothetical protein
MKITLIKLVFTFVIITIITSCSNKYSKIEKANWFVVIGKIPSDEGSFKKFGLQKK